MRYKIILKDKVFGRLKAIEECKSVSGNKSKSIHWKCICECGKEVVIDGAHLRRGTIKSCGCYKAEKDRERFIKMNTSHGMTNSQEHKTWMGMISRCYQKNTKTYKNYGARGISVCDRWLYSFENFFEDMGTKIGKEYSLDRFPDNNGNYEKNNCRWATIDQQNTNRRSNKWITYSGLTLIKRDWAIKLKIDVYNFYIWKNKGFSEIDAIRYYINKKNIVV